MNYKISTNKEYINANETMKMHADEIGKITDKFIDSIANFSSKYKVNPLMVAAICIDNLEECTKNFLETLVNRKGNNND